MTNIKYHNVSVLQACGGGGVQMNTPPPSKERSQTEMPGKHMITSDEADVYCGLGIKTEYTNTTSRNLKCFLQTLHTHA